MSTVARVLPHLTFSSTPKPHPLPTLHTSSLRLLSPPRGRRVRAVSGREEPPAVLVNTEDEVEEGGLFEYDWKEEWYPLYLTEEIPEDAPLGLTVFDHRLVLWRDGSGVVRCYDDRCPHRLAKLSEGQLVDGRLECLYHGWQFEGQGKCVKIPQLMEGAKIPTSACLKSHVTANSQGVTWVWMSDKTPPDPNRLPHFEHYDRPGFQHVSTIHELPYDHSILLENFMDPAHVPISHDRTDYYSKREDAQPLIFHVNQRTHRGFSGTWCKSSSQGMVNFLRFRAPCVLENNHDSIDDKGLKQYVSALFLCRPTGQGRSMVIMRFGTTKESAVMKALPDWFFHQNISKVLEQDMGFLSSQNEVLLRERRPTGKMYINLRSSDTWVAEYRKWMDKVGHGMPYHFGNTTISPPATPAIVEQAPAGLVAAAVSSYPAKGGFAHKFASNPINRYFRHVVHCQSCRTAVKKFECFRNMMLAMAATAMAAAILAAGRQWKVVLLALAVATWAGATACSSVVSLMVTNFIREHRRL